MPKHEAVACEELKPEAEFALLDEPLDPHLQSRASRKNSRSVARRKPPSTRATGWVCDNRSDPCDTDFRFISDTPLMLQLNKLATEKSQSNNTRGRSGHCLVLAIADDTDRREAAFGRRLDRLTRNIERLDRDLTISAEALGLFIHYWLTLIPSLPESAQVAAQAKGRERFEVFIQTLGRRLASGKTMLNEIPIDAATTEFNRAVAHSPIVPRHCVR